MPSPSRMPSSRYGVSPRASSRRTVPGLGAPVGGDQVVARGGRETRGDQRGGGGDEAVEHDGDAAGRAGQDDADEPRDLEAAERGQDAERVPGSGRLTASARRTASTFRTQTSSVTPVPRPVTIAGSAPVSAAVSALAAVVLPIPISPVPTQSGAARLDERRALGDRPDGLVTGHRGALGDARGCPARCGVGRCRRDRPAAPRHRDPRRPPAPRRGERARSRQRRPARSSRPSAR